jgi:hypothetical protein
MSTLPENDGWEDSGPPWQKPGGFRRDGQPDRSDLLNRITLVGCVPVTVAPILIFLAVLLLLDAFRRDPQRNVIVALSMVSLRVGGCPGTTSVRWPPETGIRAAQPELTMFSRRPETSRSSTYLSYVLE